MRERERREMVIRICPHSGSAGADGSVTLDEILQSRSEKNGQGSAFYLLLADETDGKKCEQVCMTAWLSMCLLKPARFGE